MEIISTEDIVSSLFVLGFDKVDPVLFTYTLEKVSSNHNNNEFRYVDKEMSESFKNCVDINHLVYTLKEEYNLEDFINNNDTKLTYYLKRVNFQEIIFKKANLYNIKRKEDIDENLFSQKEIEILTKYYEEMNRFMEKKKQYFKTLKPYK